MKKVVGVRFRPVGRIHYFTVTDNEALGYGDRVLVETDQHKELGYIALTPREMAAEDLPKNLKPVIRKATTADLQQEEQNQRDAQEAFEIGKEKILAHQLEMKLVEVHYAFDRSKMVFQFTAEGRIDFRELVRDLAAIFKTRIELRQIGVRDEAKILGGIGPCGRPLCCATFLGDFMPVSIKMAKDQNLSLNQTKISGVCGRLMCCLKYENDTYEEAKRALPDFGKEVETPDGKGRVVGLNLLDRVVKVKLYKKAIAMDYDYEELKV
ncbi:PSP1 domain-containing protein [Vagococcus lutrae]|uniref:PSP1 domain-containing protein n=1 Tax=Vagococcus lutrae TaxID=81947 RepID=UPI0023AA0FD9|nr:stage 0 sporulation family protein [Vagococcus lutrae]WEB81175.1 stage 0 sporulation family protein [Vagococcus lutrae]